MAGKGYISVVAGKEFNFGELLAMVREYFALREYAKFNNREYAEVQTEFADAWSQLMMMLDAKGIEVTIPFPS